jgi:tetratricopeptide (TPR) repeat protein
MRSSCEIRRLLNPFSVTETAYVLSCPLLRLVLTLVVALSLASASGCGGAQERKAKHMDKGETYLAAGNFDKARVEFRNVLQIDPKDPQALYRLGVIEEGAGKPSQAAKFYQAAIDLSPDSVGARAGLARLYLFSGAPERALEIIKPGLAKYPDDVKLLALRAAVRNQQRDVSGALADASRAVALAPANEDAVAVLAGIYRSQGDIAKAQALLEQTIAANPGVIDSRLALAQLDAQNGRLAEAEALLLKLIELKPSEAPHRLRLAQFYLESGQIDAAERCLRQAIKDLPSEYPLKVALIDFLSARRGRDKAEAELKAMIAATPADHDLKFALAKFYQDGKDFKQAQAIYQSIIDREKLGPIGLIARDRLAALRVETGDITGALTMTNEVLEKSPRDEFALLLRGSVALARQDPRAAIVDLQAALRDDPGAVPVLQTLARAQLANGEPESAEATMRRAVETNPKNHALRLDLARLLAQLGKPEPAQAILIDLVKEVPDDLVALDAEYRVSATMEDYVTAKSAADTVVALRPKLAIGYYYQGMLAEARNHPDEAVRLYRTALDMQPDVTDPLEAEIRILVNQKRVQEALKRLDEVSAHAPNTPFPLDLKGDVLLGNSRPVEAQQAFKQAIARAPTWWKSYRGLAAAQLAAKQDPAVAVATLRDAKAVVEQKDALGEALATMLEHMGKPDEAIAEYEEVVRAYPRSELAANNLAMLLVTYRKDRASLDRAKALTVRFAESGNVALLDTYGWVLYKRGESAASVPVLARVVAKLPDQGIARYHLGMAQALAGKNTEARDNLTRAVNSGQLFAGRDEAKAMLDKIANLPDAAVVAASPKT